jgi:hypothetical protein
MEREARDNPEKEIKTLIDRLEIREEINYEFYKRGPWYKQYGNTCDPDGEYEIRLNQGSIDWTRIAQNKIWQLGSGKPELLGQIIKGLLNKQLPPDETHYVISRTETGFQVVTPEPSDEAGMSWISVPETKRMIEETVLGFGIKALPPLETINSKASRDLITKIKRHELVRRIKSIFIKK